MESLRRSRLTRTATWLVLPLCLLGIAHAQNDRITGPIDYYNTVSLPGHLNPLARAEFDRGTVAPDFLLRGMTLTVRRTAAQRAGSGSVTRRAAESGVRTVSSMVDARAVRRALRGRRDDLAALRQWLESEGFRIKAVARGRSFIRFDGTAQQVRTAFATEIHYYLAGGVKHYANAGEPSVPANVAPLVLAIRGLDDFGPHPHYVKYARPRTKAGPDYTYGGSNALAPGDLYTIYDMTASYGWGWQGSGQTIVLVDASDVTASDIALYRTSFGLPATTVQTVQPDGDPGLVEGWQTEATLDLEIAGAAAPYAQLLLDADLNVWNAVEDAIDNFRGQIVSMSFGECELYVGSGAAVANEAVAQQANAQGMTLVASAGDSGGAGCDADGSSTPVPLSPAAAVEMPASIPEVTGVGGTEFNEGIGSYWGTTNSASGGTAKSYIPEVVWNDIGALDNILWAGGGGVSTLFTKPTWQTGTGVPADGHRDVPDVAFTASGAHDGYVIAMDGALSTAGSQPYTIGGTSASAPLFAGIVAVLNSGTYDDSSGNINPMLYTIAAGSHGSEAFHDITSGDNRVENVDGSFYGYTATVGYDQTTGLGSVDVAQLNAAWTTYTTAPFIRSLSPSTSKPGAGSSLSMAISGARFQSGDTVESTAGSTTTTLSSTYNNSGSITATVPSSLLAAAGVAQVQVLNAAGLYSGALPFDITGASVTSLSPTSATAGGKNFTLTVNGSDFVSGAKIMWNSTALTTTFSSSTKLTGAVTQAMIANPGMFSITVVDGNQGTSASTSFEVTIGTPTISSLSPSSSPAGGSGFTLTVNGSNYISASTVMWGFTPLTTVFSSSAKLTATVTGAQLTAAGPVKVTVESEGPVSSSSTFTVSSPTISSLNPKTIAAGSSSTTLIVAGTNFVAGTTSNGTFTAGSVVYIGSTALTITAGTATSITATVPGSMLGSVASLSVTVQNPNDDATSSAYTLAVVAPTISSLSPKSIAAGSSSTTLTVAGTNFIAGTTSDGTFTAGSVAYIGSTALTVTAGTATSITATVPGTMLGSVASLSVTVKNPNGGAVSSASILSVVAPIISSLTPKSIAAGSSSTTLTVAGSNFIAGTTSDGTFTAGSVAYVGGTALTVTAGTATSITATVPGSMLGSAGNLSVTVQNPNGGATSAVSTLTVLAPIISSLSPKSIAAGSSSTTLTVTGNNFIAGATSNGTFTAGSVAYIGSTALTVTAGTATSITATVPGSMLGSVASLSVTVQNPNGGATSTASALSVVAPAISSLSPKSIAAGSSSTTLTVTGTNFIAGTTSDGTFTAGSVANIGSTALTITAGTATSITATVPGSMLGSVASLGVTVQNPNGGATSTASTVTVVAPAISSLSPKTLPAGSSSTTLTVTGTNFIAGTTSDGTFTAGSVAYVGSTALTVTAGTATSITATVPGSMLGSAASLGVTVKNPNGGATSAASTLTVAAPVISSLSPKTLPAGSSSTTLTVTGTNFIAGTTSDGTFTAGSVAYVGSTALTITAGTATSITATLPGSMMASAGNLSVTVKNPSGGATSAASTLTVAAPVISSLSPKTLPAGSSGTTLTVTGTNFIAGTTSDGTFTARLGSLRGQHGANDHGGHGNFHHRHAPGQHDRQRRESERYG